METKKQLPIRESENGYFYLMLDVCDCSVLRHLLHPEGNFIWIHSHRPDPALRWWNADVPISRDDILRNAEIRLMEYDLMIQREDFIKNLNRFLSHGIELTQLSRPVPDSLWIQTLPKDNEARILIQNGMKSQFYLPHAGEVAQFSCVDRNHIGAVCAIPEIRDLLLSP